MCINKGFENELLEFSIESEENRILAKSAVSLWDENKNTLTNKRLIFYQLIMLNINL